MPMRSQRQRQTDYANIYFGFIVWRAIFRILGAIGAGLFVVLYFIVDAIDPDDAPTFIAGTVVCLIAAGVLAVLYLIVAVTYRLFVPRPRRTNADIERELGWTPNPPPGVSWFRDNGEKKQYDHGTGTWL
jgi:peptidoglycan/LPS O-acetylase OafA/YrhL